jgi:hypothetical protein
MTRIKPRFGWNGRRDARSLKFPLRLAMSLDRPLKSKLWDLPLVLSQGNDSTCVGCGWTGELIARPAPVRFPDAHAAYDYARDMVYDLATTLDDDPYNDRDHDAGTSTTAGATACVRLGYYNGYHWAMSAEEMAQAIAYHGPVVSGLGWTTNMLKVSSTGFIYAKGVVEGGHETVWIGVNAPNRYLIGQNSWGTSWGLRGRMYLNFDDMDKLLQAGGDACVPNRRDGRRLKPVYVEF